jgi:hypothetical protein
MQKKLIHRLDVFGEKSHDSCPFLARRFLLKRLAWEPVPERRNPARDRPALFIRAVALCPSANKDQSILVERSEPSAILCVANSKFERCARIETKNTAGLRPGLEQSRVATAIGGHCEGIGLARQRRHPV